METTNTNYRLEKELARLARNADRRVAREKAKGIHVASPSAAGSPGPSNANGPASASGADGTTPQKGRGRNKEGTARKCANCGQVGHIKTNKKYAKKPSYLCDPCNTSQSTNGSSKKSKGRLASAYPAARDSSTDNISGNESNAAVVSTSAWLFS